MDIPVLVAQPRTPPVLSEPRTHSHLELGNKMERMMHPVPPLPSPPLPFPLTGHLQAVPGGWPYAGAPEEEGPSGDPANAGEQPSQLHPVWPRGAQESQLQPPGGGGEEEEDWQRGAPEQR